MGMVQDVPKWAPVYDGRWPSGWCRGTVLLLLLAAVSICGSSSWGTKCGWATVNPETTLCCAGLVYLRSGVSPACCGSVAYDAMYSYCCNGRVRRKSGFGRCCGQSSYDRRSATCRDGAVMARPLSRGNICCVRNNRWRCCAPGLSCCSSGGGSAVEVPGFRPACCELATSGTKARCCSVVTQRTGAMPACCDNDWLRPTCCQSTSGTIKCCTSTYGRPSCCQSKGLYNYGNGYGYRLTTTQRPWNNVAPMPRPSVRDDSCCYSLYPKPSCCSSLTPSTGDGRTYDNSLPTNRIRDGEPASVSAGKCCVRRRYSCCVIKERTRQERCCIAAPIILGRPPLCCSGYRASAVSYTTALPPQHRCYACHLSGVPSDPPPLVDGPGWKTGRGHGQRSSSEGQGMANSRRQNWAPLSCCQSHYQKQCCKNARRLAGVFAACCSRDTAVDAADAPADQRGLWSMRTGTGDRRQQGSREGKPPTEKAFCSERPYDASYFICCFGVIRPRQSANSACCGTVVFDASSYECCAGNSVRRSCVQRNYEQVQTQWTHYSYLR